jgi:hypothetical protein
MKKAKGPLVLLNLDKAGQSTTDETAASETTQKPADESIPSHASVQEPRFEILGRRPGLAWDLLRAALIVLTLIVAAGFALVVLPQSAVDKLASNLEARHASAQQEKIALLYLGDDMTGNNDFRVRGLVRNISNSPIEQLDAAVRFYAHDGTILETTVVRMNKETIAPNETAQFELVYPNYKMDFGSYSVDFKLRQGSPVDYRDMRATK